MKKVLITGGSGFLGKRVIRHFEDELYEITLLSRTKISGYNTIISSLPDIVPAIESLFDVVVHLAGKAHMIPQMPSEISHFFEVNTEGTKALLKALEPVSNTLKVFVNASTIAVYGKTQGQAISESTPLNANTPYGQSKLQAEKLVQEWCEQRDIKYFNLRMPLIIGDNAPGNLRRMLKSISGGWYVRIKNNSARKSMVLAADIANLITQLEDKPSGNYNLSDGYHPTMIEVENALEEATNNKIKITLPLAVGKAFAKSGDFLAKMGLSPPLDSLRLQKLTTDLTVDDRKARSQLNWNPKSVIHSLKSLT